MNRPLNLRRVAAAGMALMLSLALAACFVLPGKFAATLDVRKDGRFAYTYKGEVFVLGLSKLAQMGNQAANTPFEATPCYDLETDKERSCTTNELDQQKADWEESRKASAESQKKEAEGMKAILGGIDPNDPRAGEELAERLRKQAGWNSVIYKGDGLYQVDFSVSGRLDHDFSFPTIERMPTILPFTAINRRADGSIRIGSPVFENANNGGQSGGLAQMAAIGAMGKGKPEGDEGLPQVDGTFTLTTDGEILANNTEDGPKADPTGKQLEWKINVRNPGAPMALIGLRK